MDDEIKFEVYIEVVYIQEWRDGAVFRTESGGCRWMPKDIVDANVPSVTNVMYVAATDEFAMSNMTIRRARAAQS